MKTNLQGRDAGIAFAFSVILNKSGFFELATDLMIVFLAGTEITKENFVKTVLIGMLMSLLSSISFAISEGHDRVFLVVEHVQSGEFFIERAPVIGCYGLLRGPQLAQWTSKYKVPSGIGCGSMKTLENINYLTCAKILTSKESNDFSTFSEITLDISNCEAKNNPQFLTMVRTSAKLNFPQPRGEVRLTLKK